MLHRRPTASLFRRLVAVADARIASSTVRVHRSLVRARAIASERHHESRPNVPTLPRSRHPDRLTTTTSARARFVQTTATTSFARAYGAGFLQKDEVRDRVMRVVKNFAKVDAGKVTPTSAFAPDLGLDSLDTVEVVMAMEEEFAVEIPDAEADKIQSIPEAVAYLASNPNAK